MEALFLLARSVAGATLVALGFCLMFGGCIAVLRLADVYTRIHAALITTFGAVAALLGLACVAADAAVAFRLLLLAVLMGALGPTLSQLVANGAHTGGIAPLTGAAALRGKTGSRP